MRMESLLGDPKLVKDTLEFVEKPGRFNLTVYVDPLSCKFILKFPLPRHSRNSDTKLWKCSEQLCCADHVVLTDLHSKDERRWL